MREFVIYSKTASTAPFIKDLKSAGRHDILLHSIISALFASNEFRDDVILHLILMGPPNAPRRISIQFKDGNSISKKDLKKLIEIALRKYKDKKTIEVHPGVFVDNTSLEELVEIKQDENKDIFILDFAGENIKRIKENKNFNLNDSVFILGDHEGFDRKTKKNLKKKVNKLSLGSKIYFTSQAITIINYEIDNLN